MKVTPARMADRLDKKPEVFGDKRGFSCARLAVNES